MHVQANDVPESERYELNKMHDRLTSVEPIGDEGRISATVKEMSDTDAVEIARTILLIADSVRSALND